MARSVAPNASYTVCICMVYKTKVYGEYIHIYCTSEKGTKQNGPLLNDKRNVL